MSFAPSTVAEAEAMHAAARAYALPHIQVAQTNMLVLAGDLEEILQYVPRQLIEHATVTEVAALLRRYAAQLGAVDETAPAASADQVLGVARRVAVEEINRAADAQADQTVLQLAQMLDMPVMEMPRLIDAVTAAALRIVDARARGVTLTAAEEAFATASNLARDRQAAIRAVQRDHVRAVDALTDVAAVQAYPAGVVWP
jgi:hypothetical protein